MHRIEYQTTFSAAHALVIAGVREPLHGHDWQVTATLEGEALDGDGLLVDFHALAEDVEAIVKPWRNRCLNEVSPFDRVNPSAERVAEAIGGELLRRVQTRGSERPKNTGRPAVRVASVRVTEAVGCAATYVPGDE